MCRWQSDDRAVTSPCTWSFPSFMRGSAIFLTSIQVLFFSAEKDQEDISPGNRLNDEDVLSADRLLHIYSGLCAQVRSRWARANKDDGRTWKGAAAELFCHLTRVSLLVYHRLAQFYTQASRKKKNKKVRSGEHHNKNLAATTRRKPIHVGCRSKAFKPLLHRL